MNPSKIFTIPVDMMYLVIVSRPKIVSYYTVDISLVSQVLMSKHCVNEEKCNTNGVSETFCGDPLVEHLSINFIQFATFSIPIEDNDG